ncbi:acyl-CoA thioesterase ['Paenibacillus yunnanensis' Narsing Rao et al. 2020]|uniref:acyl-CoA thioesterase n=1 Tax=Paenibacillus tengchongensis TaxID=2608684 RepID=UPI00124CFF44|nr:thioesterase family protein [Paenibacillus tengchongensis]
MKSQEPPSAGRWYGTAFRVRYQETDRMGVVYHANYLSWFESGRTEMFRRLGLTYRSMEEMGVLLPVTAADLQYKAPARYDDLVAVFARITVCSALRVGYEYEVRRIGSGEAQAESVQEFPHFPAPLSREELPGELLVAGTTSHVWVNGEWKPVRLDRALPELYQAIQGALGEEGGK